MSCAWIDRIPSADEKRAFRASSIADQRGVVRRDRHARHADHADLHAAIERDVHDRGDVDDDERRAVQPDRKPQAAALGRDAVADLHQLAHRIVGQRAAVVERRDQDEARNLVHVVGHDQLAVVPDAQADGLDLDDRRNPDDDEHAGEDEDAGVVALRVVGLWSTRRPRPGRTP